ncbi:MAG: sulfatase-like hydrolase/transferase [Nitrospinae bacterium]|nr:sulfatase-like hydrolase/transferase [Nitrospinota bacterium]
MPNNLVYIIMDSCRYDSYSAAATPNMDLIGKGERRYSFASWTSPSHYVLLMGMSPHTSPSGVFASEVYKEDFVKWRHRLGVEDLDFKSFVPELSLPCKLKKLGYKTVGKVSLPVLNKFTTISAHFDEYKLMDNHNDFAGMVNEMTFDPARPSFYFLNLGETHYPYMLTKEQIPVLHGVHGVFKHMDDSGDEKVEFFDSEKMAFLKNRQVQCVEYIDGILGALYKKCPPDTHFIITADHGELFGEGGYFGHGPIFHEKVFEVPFLEGRLPGAPS